MSFSFNFGVEDDLDPELIAATSSVDLNKPDSLPTQSTSAIPYAQVSLTELLATLPPLISYTPIRVPLSSSPSAYITLLRRDLFDARFQIVHQEEEQDEDDDVDEAEEERVFVDETTDLVSNVYEGGLKTWECSLDLIDALDGIGVGETIKGKSILELGCGTALPSCFLFYTLLKQILSISTEPSSLDDSPSPPTTTFHLQDYNRQVLSLITLPNLLLAYAHVLASEHGVLPPGEVDLSPEFLSSFTRMLEEKKIILEFSEGSWDGMNVEEKKFGLVISSETIYSLDSLGSLLGVLKRSCWSSSSLPTEKEGEKTTTCLIAAKRIYFGVGGGELEFRKRVTAEEVGGKVETVWGEGKGDGKSSGVGRIVMSVLWP